MGNSNSPANRRKKHKATVTNNLREISGRNRMILFWSCISKTMKEAGDRKIRR